MSFIQQYLDLGKQKKAARAYMKQKQNAITYRGADIVKEGKICLKEFPVLSAINSSDNGFVEVKVDCCDAFCKTEYCVCDDCPIVQENHEFVDAVRAYKEAKAAQRNFLRNALKIRKR